MIIPTYINVQYVDDDKFLTDQIRMYTDELNNVLRNGLSDNGWTLPVVTKAQLAAIIALPEDQALPNGTIWAVQDTPPLPAAQYNEIVVLLDDGTGAGTSTLYKLTKTPYP